MDTYLTCELPAASFVLTFIPQQSYAIVNNYALNFTLSSQTKPIPIFLDPLPVKSGSLNYVCPKPSQLKNSRNASPPTRLPLLNPVADILTDSIVLTYSTLLVNANYIPERFTLL